MEGVQNSDDRARINVATHHHALPIWAELERSPLPISLSLIVEAESTERSLKTERVELKL